jgi:hypothetical protein
VVVRRLCDDGGTDGEDKATEGDHVASGSTGGLGDVAALGSATSDAGRGLLRGGGGGSHGAGTGGHGGVGAHGDGHGGTRNNGSGSGDNDDRGDGSSLSDGDCDVVSIVIG